MVIKDASLEIIATRRSQYPEDGKPEFLLVGRSNVGKSSFINAILSRKNLAYTSSRPGKTQTLNFYSVNDSFYLIDVPGYGYASVDKKTQSKFGMMIEEYLQKREELRAIILLIDIRHEPGKNDIMMYDWLKHYGYDIIIAATKSDKINRSQIQKHLSVIRKTLGLGPDDVLIPFSGEKKTGVQELWAEIERFLGWYDKLKGIKYAALRYFNAAGYDPEGVVCGLERNPANLLPVVMEVAAGLRPEVKIFGNDYDTPDGTGVRDYVHVTDLADAHVKALHYIVKNDQSLAVNLGSENGISVDEMVTAARKITGEAVPAVYVERRAGDPAKLVASSKKAKELLKWVPGYSDVDTLVKTTWEAYLKNKK